MADKVNQKSINPRINLLNPRHTVIGASKHLKRRWMQGRDIAVDDNEPAIDQVAYNGICFGTAEAEVRTKALDRDALAQLQCPQHKLVDNGKSAVTCHVGRNQKSTTGNVEPISTDGNRLSQWRDCHHNSPAAIVIARVG
ncbi:hypothetical protein ACQPTN_11020 [Bradyrhizobium sp. 13971]